MKCYSHQYCLYFETSEDKKDGYLRALKKYPGIFPNTFFTFLSLLPYKLIIAFFRTRHKNPLSEPTSAFEKCLEASSLFLFEFTALQASDFQIIRINDIKIVLTKNDTCYLLYFELQMAKVFG